MSRVTIAVAMMLAGCGGDGSGTPSGGVGAFSFSGTTSGGSVSKATIGVAWMVSSGSPDYTFSYGSGSLSGTGFQVSFASDPPPAEALNSSGVGIGIVVAFEPGTSVPQGKVDFDLLESKILGLSARDAVIYKKPDASGPDWAGQFQPGYSCGVCGPAPTGSSFDTYAPAECSTLKIDFSGTEEFCNWT